MDAGFYRVERTVAGRDPERYVTRSVWDLVKSTTLTGGIVTLLAPDPIRLCEGTWVEGPETYVHMNFLALSGQRNAFRPDRPGGL